MEIRAQVRDQITDTIPNLSDLARSQSQQVINMAAEIIRSQEDLKRQRNTSAFYTDYLTERNREVINDADVAVAVPPGIAAVFDECVDPPSQKAIKGN